MLSTNPDNVLGRLVAGRGMYRDHEVRRRPDRPPRTPPRRRDRPSRRRQPPPGPHPLPTARTTRDAALRGRVAVGVRARPTPRTAASSRRAAGRSGACPAATSSPTRHGSARTAPSWDASWAA
ncbi:MAG: hypothetical protein U5R31_17060 [Acidimicrobiia bacterium]|nr:hypothetical protein [Acidimicrobiia bacterium]